jgi:3',5'-cyclic-AMP phosphodiesterase
MARRFSADRARTVHEPPGTAPRGHIMARQNDRVPGCRRHLRSAGNLARRWRVAATALRLATIPAGMFDRLSISTRCSGALVFASLLLALLQSIPGSPAPGSFRFAILGDRTGEPQPGVYEQVWKEVAAENPAFVVGVGDTIQGMNDAGAEAEWREVDRILGPFRRYPLYLAAGNHDVWSPQSEGLFQQHAEHALHYSFDFGQVHFTVLDNSRSDELSAQELAFLEADLKAHASQPLKMVISHRPSWIVDVAIRNPNFALHQLARRYGVQYVVAGHLHQMLHLELEGVTYVSMASSGGHLRSSGIYEDGWFFGHALVEVHGNGIDFRIEESGPPRGEGRITKLADWGMAGLVKKDRPERAPVK